MSEAPTWDVADLQVRVTADVVIVEGKPPLPVSFIRDAVRMKDLKRLEELQQAQASEKIEERAAASIEFLLMVGLQWGLTQNGNPLPVTRATLEERGTLLVGAIIDAVREASTPKDPNARA